MYIVETQFGLEPPKYHSEWIELKNAEDMADVLDGKFSDGDVKVTIRKSNNQDWALRKDREMGL